MQRYIARRLLLMVPTLLGAVTLIFFLMRVVPGDVALYILGASQAGDVREEQLQQIRQELGLDQPLHVQYGRWLWDAARLDFGDSLWTGRPVVQELAQRYPLSLSLALLSLAVAVAIALPVGVLSALRRDTAADYALRIFALSGLSLPSFWLAILVILGLSRYLGWLPPLEYAPLWEDPWTNLQQLLFPALVVGYRFSAVAARMTRSSVLEVLGEDYVRTARAKGLPESLVVARHTLRNALIPILTVIGVELLILLGGLVIIETVFAIPGIGGYLVDAIAHRDYASIQAVVFVLAVLVMVVNLVVDMAYAYLDPRIRYG